MTFIFLDSENKLASFNEFLPFLIKAWNNKVVSYSENILKMSLKMLPFNSFWSLLVAVFVTFV